MPFNTSDDEAQRAFLFHCAFEADLHAISLDRSGSNIMPGQCPTGWVLDQEVMIGVQDALPVALAPEPVLRGLRNVGFYVWKEGSNPKSTTQ
jgi:hypothetical protein